MLLPELCHSRGQHITVNFDRGKKVQAVDATILLASEVTAATPLKLFAAGAQKREAFENKLELLSLRRVILEQFGHCFVDPALKLCRVLWRVKRLRCLATPDLLF